MSVFAGLFVFLLIAPFRGFKTMTGDESAGVAFGLLATRLGQVSRGRSSRQKRLLGGEGVVDRASLGEAIEWRGGDSGAVRHGLGAAAGRWCGAGERWEDLSLDLSGRMRTGNARVACSVLTTQ
jgi:hypothetical protein